jgi:hypothetical protein
VKPLREESGSDEDAEEPEEWELDDEDSCSEEEGEEKVTGLQVSAPRRRARSHL